ncbi:MAG: hypothetical protein KY469_22415 [Actinobacteria bacterium]|nr:hypothetical protein [Actinomycetota bacterium]
MARLSTRCSEQRRRGWRYLRTGLVIALSIGATLALVAPAAATPVATTEEEREALGRTFLEPSSSVDYITFGRDEATGVSEFVDGMQLLEDLYPRYLEFSTIDEELGEPSAVSTGQDGVAAWHPDDTGDGLPFHVAVLTDRSVPDDDKQYVALMASHQLEPCGREGIIRTIEDLLIWATEEPDRTIDDASGLTGDEHELTAQEVLERTKIYVLSVNPDGWIVGDHRGGTFSQDTGGGFNSNRVAYQTGWVFPPTDVLYDNGYSVLTEPEGAAPTKYLRQVRDEELGGRAFAAAADVHGPVPFGYIFLHDQGNDPVKLIGAQDLATRVEQNMDEVHARYATEPGAEGIERAVGVADEATRDERGFYPLQWATYGHIWETFNYTVSASWGGWMNSDAGLDATSLSYEINCRPGPWEPMEQQVLQDNVRAIVQTYAVWAATRDEAPTPARDLEGRVGFLDVPRVTDADGNPSPPPDGHPGTPLTPQIEQTPYDVANVDYLRDVRELVPNDVDAVAPDELDAALRSLDSFVIADATTNDVDALRRFVSDGGNLVLTDAALQLLPDLLGEDGLDPDVTSSYVGYADLVDDHWLTEDLHSWARQTYDPIGLGYPILMERDAYWTTTEDSGTENSAPIWTVDREAFEAADGVTAGTVDPADGPKGEREGDSTDRAEIGTIERGEGRIVFFGALLPQPTEEYAHWFGLDAYTVSIAGQEMMLRALTWTRDTASDAGQTQAPASADEADDEPLPATGADPTLPIAAAVLLLAALVAQRCTRNAWTLPGRN